MVQVKAELHNSLDTFASCLAKAIESDAKLQIFGEETETTTPSLIPPLPGALFTSRNLQRVPRYLDGQRLRMESIDEGIVKDGQEEEEEEDKSKDVDWRCLFSRGEEKKNCDLIIILLCSYGLWVHEETQWKQHIMYQRYKGQMALLNFVNQSYISPISNIGSLNDCILSFHYMCVFFFFLSCFVVWTLYAFFLRYSCKYNLMCVVW